ncbi:MAG: glucose 1-dehydrogenase [Acidimicrobiia bacterium]|nr:glucose 1-dehydrogenase [Acidimicrobiia bacterium]MYG58926.1 glucose 1-dehydrogenase [Acidimicrobiia bacterium]MYJ33630.1 glucose 1-dehydrogenase [Acidimicrobiia bacterium]
MGRLDNKVALVSGGARGMGQSHCRVFAAEGAKVMVADILDDEGKAVAADIGPNAVFQHLDVTSEDDWAAAIDAVTETFGRLDVLVNNAGIAEPSPLAELSLDSYRRVTEVNQTGVFLGMRAAVRPMTESGGGSIINISSIDGQVGMDNLTSYIASKWAVRGMTKTAAMELAPLGIRVNSIHPGFILTHMGSNAEVTPEEVHERLEVYSARMAPMGRAGVPEEISRLALFLASDESSYSTGSEFVSDGGFTAGYPNPGVSLP